MFQAKEITCTKGWAAGEGYLCQENEGRFVQLNSVGEVGNRRVRRGRQRLDHIAQCKPWKMGLYYLNAKTKWLLRRSKSEARYMMETIASPTVAGGFLPLCHLGSP